MRLTADKARGLFAYDNGKLRWLVDGGPRHVGAVAGTERHGYWIISTGGKMYTRAQLVWLLHHGEFPGRQIAHVNGNRTDDRIENLKLRREGGVRSPTARSRVKRNHTN